MTRFIGRLLGEERGGTAIEYGFILALVVIALMAALMAFADAASSVWSFVASQVVGAR